MKNNFLDKNTLVDKYLYQKKIIYILIFILSITIPAIWVLYKGEMWNVSKSVIIIIELILLGFNLDLIVLNILQRGSKIEHLFLSLMIPIGSFYLVCLIPNNVYDEAAHSYRTYVISEGHIITDRTEEKGAKMEVPEQLIDSIEIHTYKELITALKEKPEQSKELVGPNGTGAASYSFVSYFFPAIGMKLGTIFHANILISYYLARIVAFIAFLVFSFFTIQKLPFAKIVMLVYLFNPMLIQQCVSISADNIINCIALLLIALILNKMFAKEPLTKKELWTIAGLSCLLATMKYVYFPIVFLMLLLWKKHPKNKKSIFIILITTTIVAILFYFLASNMYISSNNYVIENHINAADQLSFILHNPIIYVKVLLNTIITNSSFYFFTLFGRNLGNFTISIPDILPILYAYLLLISSFLENNKKELEKFQKLWIIFIILGVYILIETGLYLLWTAVGANIIEGVQGRYFLPFAILIPMLYISKKNEIHFKNRNFWISMSLVCLNLLSIYKILQFFNF